MMVAQWLDNVRLDVRVRLVRLAYSTLAFPSEAVEHVAELGARCGFGGVEIRLLEGRLLPPIAEPGERRRVKQVFNARGLQIVAIDTSLRLVEADFTQRLAGYVALAAAWEAPVVRVFGGPLGGAEREVMLSGAAERLAAGAQLAAAQGVVVGLETHDDFSRAATVAEALALAGTDGAGAVWDLHHPHRCGESPEDVWRAIGERLVHVHLKDAVRHADAWRLVPLGEGELPVATAVDRLRAGGYRGWLSVEWERAWHPELASAAEVLPRDADWLRRALDAG